MHIFSLTNTDEEITIARNCCTCYKRLTYFILLTIVQYTCYYPPQFTDEETEACLYSQESAEQGSDPGCLGPGILLRTVGLCSLNI